MAFCLEYYPFQDRVYKEVGQIKIKYNPKDITLEEFLEKYIDKTIIIDVTGQFEDNDAKLLKGLYDKYKNIKLIIDCYDEDHLNKVIEYDIPFFFCNYANSLDKMAGLAKYYPTDMYICEELGFSLEKVSDFLHSKDIKVRVFPNICQSNFAKTPSLVTFFIRPEDIELYSQYVDVFELIADKDRQGIIYKVYKQGKWFGPIKEIIPSFKHDLDSRFLIKAFGEIRIKCGKRCLYKPKSCNICDSLVDLAKLFEEHNIVIKPKKERIETDGSQGNRNKTENYSENS